MLRDCERDDVSPARWCSEIRGWVQMQAGAVGLFSLGWGLCDKVEEGGSPGPSEENSEFQSRALGQVC